MHQGAMRAAAVMPQFVNPSFNYRVPPAWSPELARRGANSYSFRAWSRDIVLRTALTDLTPGQQASAITLRLGGGARRGGAAPPTGEGGTLR